ncbi:MAG: hypothetical protein BYD32DRAFT_109193 [Podila humilis]|nr:MAG: hypothetical protein BYD32DRAFT_109193 [Podila humilis]
MGERETMSIGACFCLFGCCCCRCFCCCCCCGSCSDGSCGWCCLCGQGEEVEERDANDRLVVFCCCCGGVRSGKLRVVVSSEVVEDMCGKRGAQRHKGTKHKHKHEGEKEKTVSLR